MKALQVGDLLPTFTLHNQDDQPITISPDSGQPMVIYFYPKDDSPGCTAESCSFRDHFADFQDAGAQVYGVSADSTASHRAFKEKHRLPFDLLSDPDNVIRKQFGVKPNLLGLLPGRVTFVVDASGKVVHKFTSQLNVTQHVREALDILRRTTA